LQQGSPRPQHATAWQHDIASLATVPGDAAKAAELEASMIAAKKSFLFMHYLLS
jgi:hypothetical protein